MKVLFAVSDDNVSESIVKEYQKQFKEIISYKNVYYFNAIIKELQKDNSYDRIVISEDLEPFASNNYDTIDKFLFEKLDNVSDEAINSEGKDTQIILITSDRRNFGDNMLIKFFGIGVYSALVGQDRSIENVCDLIRKPRTKKEAKQYYKIDADDVNYQTENENDVSETEIQNIISHYKKLGKNTEKYLSSFNNITSQYNDEQLKIIINFLPVGVKAVLESESPKYQELVMSLGKPVKRQKITDTKYVPKKVENYKVKEVKQQGNNNIVNPNEIKIDMLENRINSTRITKPVVIPTELETSSVKKNFSSEIPRMVNTEQPRELNVEKPVTVNIEDDDEIIEEPVVQKKGRGRPRKNVAQQPETEEPVVQKKGRGRPRKVVEPVEDELEEESIDEEVNLFELEEESNNTTNYETDYKSNYDSDDEEVYQPSRQQYQPREHMAQPEYNVQQRMNKEYNTSMMQQQYVPKSDLSSLLTRDKKIVSFVGTTKNGTSFIVNNLAELFSSMGISTAILDMTQSRNAYYIYTNNDEQLRNVASKCINNLRSNIPEGIKVNKNLTVYSAIPGTSQNTEDAENILGTLLQNYSLVLIDCDFNTPFEYFYQSQEIYLVQSMDVLTIQPLTEFLRDLKSKNILDEQKLRIVINKEQRVGGLSPKMIIGGMSCYNDPSMAFSTELFDRSRVKYATIPFETQNYSAYLEALVNCSVTLKKYTKLFNSKLEELGNMVYPLIGRQYGRNGFGNNTLNVRY